MANRVLQLRVDARNLGKGPLMVKINIVGVHQRSVLSPSGVVHTRDHRPHQADKFPGLLEARVFPKPGIKIPDREVKWIRLMDASGVFLRRSIGHIHLLRVLHGLGLGPCYILNVILGRK